MLPLPCVPDGPRIQPLSGEPNARDPKRPHLYDGSLVSVIPEADHNDNAGQEHEEGDPAADSLVPTRLGSSATLECRADANPRAEITWRFGQKLLAHSGSALYLPSVSESELGEYVCEAHSPLPDFPYASARRFLLGVGIHLYSVISAHLASIFLRNVFKLPFVLVAKPKIPEITVLFGKSRAAMRTSTSDTESTRCINVTLEGRESDRSRHTFSVDVLVHSVPRPTAAHLRLLFTSGDGAQKSER